MIYVNNKPVNDIKNKALAAKARLAAKLASVAVDTWEIRRSLIPVRVEIHSSEVSKNVAKSSLLSTAGGKHFPQPVIFAYCMTSSISLLLANIMPSNVSTVTNVAS